MMTHDEYAKWWLDNIDVITADLNPGLPEPVATLAAHVIALQERVDRLTDPERHARFYGADGCRNQQCGCAYDHPAARCATHKHLWPQL